MSRAGWPRSRIPLYWNCAAESRRLRLASIAELTRVGREPLQQSFARSGRRMVRPVVAEAIGPFAADRGPRKKSNRSHSLPRAHSYPDKKLPGCRPGPASHRVLRQMGCGVHDWGRTGSGAVATGFALGWVKRAWENNPRMTMWRAAQTAAELRDQLFWCFFSNQCAQDGAIALSPHNGCGDGGVAGRRPVGCARVPFLWDQRIPLCCCGRVGRCIKFVTSARPETAFPPVPFFPFFPPRETQRSRCVRARAGRSQRSVDLGVRENHAPAGTNAGPPPPWRKWMIGATAPVCNARSLRVPPVPSVLAKARVWFSGVQMFPSKSQKQFSFSWTTKAQVLETWFSRTGTTQPGALGRARRSRTNSAAREKRPLSSRVVISPCPMCESP